MKSSIFTLLACGALLSACGGHKGAEQSLSPTYACDSAVVNITIVDFDSTTQAYLDALVSYYDNLGEIAPQKVNGDGTLTLTLPLQGDAVMTLFNASGDSRYGTVRVAPGETTDITIAGDSLTTTGRFAEFNRVMNTYEPKYGFNIFGDTNFFRYDMNGDDYTAAILAEYAERKAALEADENLTDAERLIERSELLTGLLSLASDRKFSGRCNYLTLHPGTNDIPFDSLAADMSEANYADIVMAIDPNDEALMMSRSVSTSLGPVDWNAAGAKGTLLGTLSLYQKAAKRAMANKLDPELVAELREYENPFFADAVENIQAMAQKKFEDAAKMVSETPDVPGEEIIEAIAAKYPGKVVLIDRWNTWCGPCKAGIAQNEPMKANVLSDPDIVWVYVADESSPIPAYYDMIPGIKGDHYYLTQDQAKAVYEKYNIDGIPYYFLVNRKGEVSARPDFRDHDLLVSTILEEVKK